VLFDSGCVVCAAPRGPVCSRCERLLVPAPPIVVAGLDRCSAAFALDERSRAIIAALKYRRQRRLARWLAQRTEPLVPRAADVITWLPATPERKRSRGFDQARELASALSARSGVPLVQLLERHSDDGRQTGKSRADRLAGPRLRARVRSAPFVVVIDDVVTTGSSFRAAAQVLRANGANELVGLAAVATPPRRDFCLARWQTGCSVPEWT